MKNKILETNRRRCVYSIFSRKMGIYSFVLCSIFLLSSINLLQAKSDVYDTNEIESVEVMDVNKVNETNQTIKTVKGTVRDSQGETIIGATIQLKNDHRGAITDLDGKFTISNVKPNDIIVVSYIGYKTVEFKVGNESDFNITLEDDAVAMEEVVVVGYGTQKKESVVGAISTVRPSELQSPVRSLANMLAGNLSGVISMQSSGEPGKDDAQFWIRGISTFTGNQKPLVLVDGIERPLENVDPLEIESFSVLKDASATAVYGVRGANGVVLVTTRRGFEGKPKIDIRVEQGFTSPTKRLKFVDAATRAELFNEAIDNSKGSAANKYTATEIKGMRSQSDPELYPDVDWQEALMKDITYSQKLSVNFSGGGKFARYFTAVSFFNQDGQYKVNPGSYDWVSPDMGKFGKNVSYKRYNFRTNVDMDITATTVVSLGLQGNITNNIEPNEGSDAIYTHIINTPPNAFPLIFKDGKYAGRIGLDNPYNILTQKGYKETTGNDIRADLTIKQDFAFITPGLTATLRYAYDAENYSNYGRSRTVNYYTANGRDEFGDLILKEEDADKYMDYLNFSSGASGNKTHYFEASANYARTFNEKHEVGALLLYYSKNYKVNTAGDYISSLANKSIGIAGRATYSFDRKYLAEVNVGFNGSENFPKGKRMGFFPAGAIGWIISEENFMKDVSFIDWLKVRASVGQVGNDKIGTGDRFPYLGVIGGINGYGKYYSSWGENFDQSGDGVGEFRLPSGDVQWEVATKYNLGVEFAFFKDLRINADLFYENRDNIFIQPQTSLIAGFPKAVFKNEGKMENKGFEVSVEYIKNLTKDLSISVRGNYSFARNKIIDDGQYYAYSWQDKKGSRYGVRQGYNALHLFTQEELDNMPDYYTQFNMKKSQLRAGDIRYEDLNDDGKIDEKDKTWIGNPENAPEIVYGFGSTVSYKDFDLSFLFQGAANRSAYLPASWYFQPFQAERDPKYMGNVMEMFLDRWTDENQNQYAFSPRLSAGVNSNNYQSSTWWQRDASYLRLKNIELGYTIPAALSKKWAIQKARVYVSGFNLLTISKFYKDFWDPETAADKYPLQRQVFVGINLNF